MSIIAKGRMTIAVKQTLGTYGLEKQNTLSRSGLGNQDKNSHRNSFLEFADGNPALYSS